MKRKIFIIHSEYVQHGITFNSNNRYVEMGEDADKVYEEILESLKKDNEDMISDKENYRVSKSNRKGHRFFSCFYKYQPTVSSFTVEMYPGVLE